MAPQPPFYQARQRRDAARLFCGSLHFFASVALAGGSGGQCKLCLLPSFPTTSAGHCSTAPPLPTLQFFNPNDTSSRTISQEMRMGPLGTAVHGNAPLPYAKDFETGSPTDVLRWEGWRTGAVHACMPRPPPPNKRTVTVIHPGTCRPLIGVEIFYANDPTEAGGIRIKGWVAWRVGGVWGRSEGAPSGRQARLGTGVRQHLPLCKGLGKAAMMLCRVHFKWNAFGFSVFTMHEYCESPPPVSCSVSPCSQLCSCVCACQQLNSTPGALGEEQQGRHPTRASREPLRVPHGSCCRGLLRGLQGVLET